MAGMTHSSAKNRRSSQRRSPRTTVKVEIRKGSLGLGPNIVIQFLDLSEGGLRAVVKDVLTKGGEVECLLTGYGMAKPIKRVGRVCWVVPMDDAQACIGVNFDKAVAYRDVFALVRP